MPSRILKKAKQKSIGDQLTFIIFTATFLVLFITTLLFIYWASNDAREKSIHTAQTVLKLLSQDFVRSLVLNSPDASADMVLKLKEFRPVTHCTFYNSDNEAILNYSIENEQRIAILSDSRKPVTVFGDHAIIVLPISYFGKNYGFVHARITLERFNDRLLPLLNDLTIGVAFLLLFSVFLSVALQRFFTRPIRLLVTTLHEFSHGNPSKISPDEANNEELSILFNGFNDMSERIEFAQNELYDQKERLLITLESIADGVIATDEAGYIRYMNPSAERITGWSEADALNQPAEKIYKLIDDEDSKPLKGYIEDSLVSGSVKFNSENISLVTKSENKIAIQSSISPINNDKGIVTGAVMIFQDVNESRKLSQQLEYQASHDPLTSLINRAKFDSILKQELSLLTEGTEHALLFLDLDQFKIINDTSGHTAGDTLLKQIALLLRTSVRETDIVARLGGDEFAIFLPRCNVAQATEIAEKIRSSISNFTFSWDSKNFKVGVSIGLVSLFDPNQTIEELLSAADIACYSAKDLGRNRIYVYEINDTDVQRRHGEMQWVHLITDAIEEDRLLLYAQQIESLKTGLPDHYEILVRYLNKKDDVVVPGAFLPAAERYGLAPEIDRWVIRNILLDQNLLKLCTENSLSFNINLSGLTLSETDLISYVQGLLKISNFPPESICFEITETAAVANLTSAAHFMNSMKNIGFKFALDDFGSGVSSFTYLKNLPVDYLKIDGSFVLDMNTNEINRAMIHAINEIGHVMKIQTVAEFVENKEVHEILTELGVDYAQGYFIHEPEILNKVIMRYSTETSI